MSHRNSLCRHARVNVIFEQIRSTAITMVLDEPKAVASGYPMSSDPPMEGHTLPMVPPSRTTSRRRAADLSQSHTAPTTATHTRPAPRGVTWHAEPVTDVPSIYQAIDASSSHGEQRQEVMEDGYENESLRIRHDAIEVAVDDATNSLGLDCPTDSTSPSKSNSSSNSSPVSDRKIPLTPTISQLEPSTRLHSICELPRLPEIMANAPQHLSATNAAALDENGRTPLHILSMNPALRRFPQEQMLGFVIGSLWKAFPSAMSTVDANGHIPFQFALDEWIQDMLQPSKPINGSSKPSLMTRSMLWNLMKTPPKPDNPAAGTKGQTSSPTIPSARDTATKQKQPVGSPSQKDLEGGRLFSSPALKRFVSNPQTKADDSLPTQLTSQVRVILIAMSTMLKEDTACNSKELVAKVVQHIACTSPLLIKAIFLLDDDQERKWALNTRLMHSVLTSKHSIGRWLTDMLQSSNRLVSDAALDYLRVVSDPALFDQEWIPQSEESTPSTGRRNVKRSSHSRRHLLSPDASASKQPHDPQKELYSSVSRLPGFVPSLLSLSYLQIEDAATTNLVQQVLDNHISRPFAAMVVFCDAFFLLLVIMGFRAGVNRLLLGYASGAVMKWLYVANTGIFYFIIRELGKAISLCMITRRARVYFYSKFASIVWTHLDAHEARPMLTHCNLAQVSGTYLTS